MELFLERNGISLNAGWFIPLGFLLAFGITFISIPTILKVARAKGLYDRPNKRSSHKENIPTLGGVAVFIGFVITAALCAGDGLTRQLLYIFTGLIILFFIGIKDDILVIDPVKKLIGQIIAAVVVIVLGDVRMTSFYGFLGIHQMGYVSGVLFTLFVFVVVTNGLNLVDGIDGLASGVAALASLVFGIWFFVAGQVYYAIVSLSLTGSLIAFLRFNLSHGKHKIFLGDTGSLILGMMLSVLAVRFMEYDMTAPEQVRVSSVAVMAFTILIIPLTDTLHVFIMRVLRGRSPFEAGRWHLHHRLLELGLSHLQATLVLLFLNILFILLAWWLQDLGDLSLLAIILGLALLLILSSYALIWLKRRHRHFPSGKKAFDA